MRFVSINASAPSSPPPFAFPDAVEEADAAAFPPAAVVPATDSDLCEPEDELGRSKNCSSGLGCISVKGSSATNSLKKKLLLHLLPLLGRTMHRSSRD